ncbi:MAG TPA: glycosyltransferase family 39 protein [Bacteroidales bacterium]
MNKFILDFSILIICFAGYYSSFKFYKQNNFRLSILLILISGLILRIYAGSDLFLHNWDERYHALVAKNFLDHPLIPTLYNNPVLPYYFQDWISNHIWLEKPPIPLLSMALSLKFFGVNEIAVRIPSFLISTFAIFLTYKIGSLLFSKKVGLIAAFLHSINGLLIELAAGQVSSDHVETFFLFFVELGIFLSIYAVYKNKSYLFSLLIGLVAGFSLLSKWNPGLIIIVVWFIGAYFSRQYSLQKLFINLLIILATCFFVFGSSVTYIYILFPTESKYVLSKFILAYNETVDGHQGPLYFYINDMRIVYGELIYIPILLNIYFLFQKKISWKMAMLSAWWIIPIIVFSFAETKRQTYMLIFAPAFFILISYYWFYLKFIISRINYRYTVIILLFLLLALPIRYSFERLKIFQQRDRNPQWSQEIKNIKELIPEDKAVIIFNIERPIETMFYNDCIAYPQIPDSRVIKNLQEKGYTIIINEDENLDKADYVNNQNILFIKLLSIEK